MTHSKASQVSSTAPNIACTSKSQSKEEIEPGLLAELDGHIVQISAKSFFDTFLPPVRDDAQIASRCFDALQEPPTNCEQSPDGIDSGGEGTEGMNCLYGTAGQCFPALATARQELNIYPKLETLLNFIGSFYRKVLH
ncbi:hypothetical protein M407DRAFT_34950 [Tulasnella calospora MUT 4182]|uniref:Uncharacterized protein n=1 Tax=Tulasnella calospora MUT 4182 TaxID=1051891 RepID=A0A0C3Q0I5_9AGAM|nr:hypothetical protein M407DRAFT_34950 [Tulasnella calospora MUT 4182]